MELAIGWPQGIYLTLTLLGLGGICREARRTPARSAQFLGQRDDHYLDPQPARLGRLLRIVARKIRESFAPGFHINC